MRKSVRVSIVSDLAIARAGLRLLVDSHDNLSVISETAFDKPLSNDGSDRPDIVLLDADPESARMLEALPELLVGPTPARVIILTNSLDRELQQRAVQLGASGLVSKDKPAEVLFKAIEKVHAGEVWFERATIANALSEMSRVNGKESDDDALKIAALSKREREVVVLIGEGLKNKQIADRLFLSETTVQHHLSSIFSKLRVTDRLELVIYAYRQGLVKLSPQMKKKG